MGMVLYFKEISRDEYVGLSEGNINVEDFLFPEDIEDPFVGQFCLGKIWHVLHYIISGDPGGHAEYSSMAIMGGRPVGPNLGYGQARIIDVCEVKEISEVLEMIDFSMKLQSLKREESDIKQIYHGEILKDDGIGEIIKYFDKLKAFYSKASGNDSALLIYLA
ncbi:hypothetical protein HCH_02084 [Hahella chejuensis KCTC 2396]|uniref:DUF1877 family protein n=1 Tax=Hahella chejuensis (strain KCTC 2396) TaxID=349521 RepID=Q2SKA9_HAHCH|nr:YfbM family protein [Hahella chejuensis]ABC28915.1 hypothetical protein HCH_02084 [Hahella chejuensis KCTC 2396]